MSCPNYYMIIHTLVQQTCCLSSSVIGTDSYKRRQNICEICRYNPTSHGCVRSVPVTLMITAKSSLLWRSVGWREMSKTRLWQLMFGISGFYGNLNGGLDESRVVHRIPTDQIKLFTLLIVDWTSFGWFRGKFIWVVLAC